MDASSAIEHFDIKGNILAVKPYGGGHINDTFLVTTDGNLSTPHFLLQKLNTYVFRDPAGLMNNISIVTGHIRKTLKNRQITDQDRRSLTLFETKTGDLYIEDDETGIWRVFNYIEDHKVFDKAPNAEIAFEGARKFGEFLHFLSDLNPMEIVETIPRFHDIAFRLQNLEQAIKRDPVERVKAVQDEIKYVRSKSEVMSVILNLGKKGLIPIRITHNDTKINNVLFDRSNKGLCVIDLDTIMPGFAHYDYGDGIRTCANTGEEDEQDLNNMNYDLEMFEAFSAGYIESTHDLLVREEIDSLAYAALLFPFIMGVRFLTDYISGDVYYKTRYPEHNMVRARAQLKLARDGEARFEDMKRIIRKLFAAKER